MLGFWVIGADTIAIDVCARRVAADAGPSSRQSALDAWNGPAGGGAVPRI